MADIFSFTVPHNIRSRRVMEKIGMRHSEEDDFHHPLLAADHPLGRQVLYRMRRNERGTPITPVFLDEKHCRVSYP